MISDFREFEKDDEYKEIIFTVLDKTKDSLLKLDWEKMPDRDKIINCIKYFALFLDYIRSEIETE